MKLKSKSLLLGQCHVQNAWQGTIGKIQNIMSLPGFPLVSFMQFFSSYLKNPTSIIELPSSRSGPGFQLSVSRASLLASTINVVHNLNVIIIQRKSLISVHGVCNNVPDISADWIVLSSPRPGSINSVTVHFQPISYLSETFLEYWRNGTVWGWANIH